MQLAGGSREACASGASRDPRRREITSHSHDSRAHSLITVQTAYSKASVNVPPPNCHCSPESANVQSTRVTVLCGVERQLCSLSRLTHPLTLRTHSHVSHVTRQLGSQQGMIVLYQLTALAM